MDPKTIADAFQGVKQAEREGQSTVTNPKKDTPQGVEMVGNSGKEGNMKELSQRRSSGEKEKKPSGSRKRSRSPSLTHGSKHQSHKKSSSPHNSPQSSKGGSAGATTSSHRSRSPPKPSSKHHSHSRSPSHGRTPKGSETRWVSEEGGGGLNCGIVYATRAHQMY